MSKDVKTPAAVKGMPGKYVMVEKWCDAEDDNTSAVNGQDVKLVATPKTTSSASHGGSPMVMASLMRTALKGSGPRKGPTKLRTKATYYTRLSSAAASSLSWNLALDVSVTGEFTQFKALFDEYKVHAAFVRFIYETNSVTNGVIQKWATRYTEFASNTPTTIAECLVADQMQTGVMLGSVGTACLSSASGRVKGNGYQEFHIKIPKGTATSANPYVAGQQWVSTAEAATPVHGYVSGFADASAAITSLIYLVTFDVEFRSRF